MDATLSSHRVGDAVITRVSELALDALSAGDLYPEADPAEATRSGRALGPGSYDREADAFRISVHAWLVRTPGRAVLVDAAGGSGKRRLEMPAFDRLHEPFLERLRRAGASPEEVDAVLLTHLHVDHVGWATREAGGRWRPTFPNAAHVFSARERAYVAALAAGDGGRAGAVRAEAGLGPMAREPSVEFWADSVVPVIEAGLAREVAVDGSEVLDGFSLVPLPGHSVDHAAVAFSSRGEQALFWGDVMHNPVQFAHPEWNSAFCEFPDTARRARRRALERAADTGALVLTSHFAESSAGRVAREGDRFVWRFA